MDPFRYYRHLRHTVNFVEANISEPIHVRDVAKHVGLSPSHFSTFFHKATGVRFSVWLRGLRVQKAKCMLAESDTPICQIAYEFGFGSVSAFERTFKNTESLTPSAYRKSLRNRD